MNRATLSAMAGAGMDVARLNFSHGTHETHAQSMKLCREAFAEWGMRPAFLADMPGPKIRLGAMPGGKTELEKGRRYFIEAASSSSDRNTLPLPHKTAFRALKKGLKVFLSDGTVELLVTKSSGSRIECEAMNSATVRNGGGVNIPEGELAVDAFTRRDEEHLAFAAGQGADFAAISFAASAKDIERARRFASRLSVKAPLLIAKIERAGALKNLAEIIEASDGVMVARGDMGVELPTWKVPFEQKRIIAECNRLGKPVIVATQMLESMTASPRPTRAELTDVANAVLDGADAVMLSGETSIGKYPVEAVSTLSRVAREAELHISARADRECPAFDCDAAASAAGAAAMANRLGAAAIVVPVFTGATARCLSNMRAEQPLLALCFDGNAPRLSLCWGVKPFECRRPCRDLDALTSAAREAAVVSGLAKKGDRIVLSCSLPQGGRNGRRVTSAFTI